VPRKINPFQHSVRILLKVFAQEHKYFLGLQE